MSWEISLHHQAYPGCQLPSQLESCLSTKLKFNSVYWWYLHNVNGVQNAETLLRKSNDSKEKFFHCCQKSLYLLFSRKKKKKRKSLDTL